MNDRTLPAIPGVHSGGRVLPVVPKTPGAMSITEASAFLLTPEGQQVIAHLGVVYQTQTHALLKESELLWSVHEIIGAASLFQVLSPYFGHLSARTLHNRIDLWEAFREHRELHEWVGKNYSKALTLAQSLTEGDIALLGSSDDAGKSRLDRYDTMTHADLKRHLRERDTEARKQARAIVQEETKLLKAELKLAISERDAILARAGDSDEGAQRQYFRGLSQSMSENLLAARENLESFYRALSDGRSPPESVLVQAESELQTIQTQLSEIYEEFQARTSA